MAELNLQTDWMADDVVKVSWNDTMKRTGTSGGQAAGAFGVLGFFIVGVIAAFSMGLGVFFLCIVGAFGFAIWMLTSSRVVPNSIAVDPDGLHQDGRVFRLGDISRIEYASKSKWTGNPPKEGQGDPTQIRLWLNDSANHVLSENNWEIQINHRIRDEIDAAILAIRKMEAEERHEAEHGKQGEFGMPEY